MLFKSLLFVALVVAALFFLRGLRGKRQAPPPAPQPKEALARPPKQAGSPSIVPCAHCGLHLPEAEAFIGPNGLHYCSEAHRLAHVSGRPAAGTNSRDAQ